MVMEEEKYNVNILAADSVDSSGEPNFPQKGFQSFLHRMEIRPLLCLLCQSEGKNKTMPSFLFSPPYLIIVTGTTGAARVKISVRCKFFQIERQKLHIWLFWG